MFFEDLFITSTNGETIIWKRYNDINSKAPDNFWNHLKSCKSGSLEPCLRFDDIYYFHIYRNGLYIAASSSTSNDPLLAIEILSRLYHLLKDFCGVVNITSMTANKFLVYELIEEFMDDGLVQLTVTSNLKPYIQSQPIPINNPDEADYLLPNLFGIENLSIKGDSMDKPVISSIADHESRKEEIFVDIIEHITAVVEKNGKVSQSRISGKIKMKSFLNNPHTIRLALVENLLLPKDPNYAGFGDNPRIDSCSFNPNVQTDQFETKKQLLISPEEGEFDVMTYQINDKIPKGLPFRMTCNVDLYPDARTVDIDLGLNCDFPSDVEAVNMKVSCPVPEYITSIKQRANDTSNNIEFDKLNHCLIWAINRISGKSLAYSILQLNYENNHDSVFEMGPIKLEFEISGYVCSAIQIKYLKVFHLNKCFTPARWIRYISVADSYAIRV